MGRRKPAVSTNRTVPPGHSTRASTASRVVPASSNTTERSCPTSRLNRLDLPTFGRPTSANRGSSPSGAAPSSSGRSSTTRSRRSPEFRPCIAETVSGSPRPSEWNASASASSRSPSTLFTTRTTGTVTRRRVRARRASSSTGPVCASTTTRITSASEAARSAWRETSASMPRAPWTNPPVSTSRNVRPRHVVSSSTRSRVTPGISWAIASRRPNSRFTSVDFPTFCRPTTATAGRLTGRAPRAGRG